MRFLGLAALAAGVAIAGAANASVVYHEGFDGYDLSGVAVNAHTAGTSSTSGNSFTTDYNFRTGASNTGADSMYDEGTWTITTNPIATHDLWVDLGPGQTNNFLILNGDTTVPSTDWLSNAFAVGAGDYTFSFDLMNVCCNARHPSTVPSVLWFEFTDDNGATFNIAAGPIGSTLTAGVWVNEIGHFHLNSAGTLRVGLFDTDGASDGNDFAVDNITVTSVPEPMTWALMIGGFGLAGASLRRRRALAA